MFHRDGGAPPRVRPFDILHGNVNPFIYLPASTLPDDASTG
jgi:hypothetical protein